MKVYQKRQLNVNGETLKISIVKMEKGDLRLPFDSSDMQRSNGESISSGFDICVKSTIPVGKLCIGDYMGNDNWNKCSILKFRYHEISTYEICSHQNINELYNAKKFALHCFRIWKHYVKKAM